MRPQLVMISVVLMAASPAAAQSVQRQITSHPAQDRCPRWSPDGQRIVFESNRAGSWDLWLIRPDGSDLRRLTDAPGDERFPAWGPSGGRIVFVSDQGSGPDLRLIDLGTGRSSLVVAAPGRGPVTAVWCTPRTPAMATTT